MFNGEIRLQRPFTIKYAIGRAASVYGKQREAVISKMEEKTAGHDCRLLDF